MKYIDLLEKRPKYNSNWATPIDIHTKQLIHTLIRSNTTILDYGCGSGTLGWIGFNNDNGILVDGYDINTNPIAKYHNLSEIHEVYDTILAAELVEHMTPIELENMVGWCFKHAKHLIISTPNVFDTPSLLRFFEDITHIRPMNTPDLPGMIRAAGYGVVNSFYCEPCRDPHRRFMARLSCAKPYYALVINATVKHV